MAENTKPFRLFELPYEIQVQVWIAVVQCRGLRRSNKFRLVNHYMDSLMLEALGRSGLIGPERTGVPPKALEQYLLRQSGTASGLAAYIKSVMRIISPFVTDSHEALKLHSLATKALCFQLAHYMSSQHIIKPETPDLTYSTPFSFPIEPANRQWSAQIMQRDWSPISNEDSIHGAIVVAFYANRLHIVRALISQWKASDISSRFFPSPLELAVKNVELYDLFEDLLAHISTSEFARQSPQAFFEVYQTAWEAAIGACNKRASKRLDKDHRCLSSSVQSPSRYRRAIGAAVKACNQDILRELVQLGGEKYNKTSIAYLVLYVACAHDRPDAADYAFYSLGAAASFDIYQCPYYIQPLQLAAISGSGSVIRLLLNGYASSPLPTPKVDSRSLSESLLDVFTVNISVKRTEHAIELAAMFGFIDVVHALFQASDPTQRPSTRRIFMALDKAATRGHVEFVKTVLSYCPLEQLEKDLYTLSLVVDDAAREGQDAVLRVIAAHGLPLDDPEGEESYAVQYAKAFGHWNTVESLLALGCRDLDLPQDWLAEAHLTGEVPLSPRLG